ncbi:MAG: Rpn family recombination-promoting nuclease/putative transposase [Lachnospiraceae bacterium]|nr:Rpn family recombination-promoting nuclease/putative transposase [Lachnospiraceae bacterium]
MKTNDYSQNVTHTEQPCTMPFAHSDFEKATGRIPYNMTNDYMFRAVFQSSNKALRGLICSLLHLADSEVTSVEITNPILLGDSIDDKEFRLDIHLLLNDRTRINLEMQITNRLNWQSRSVMYLCRSYDQLNRGQDYKDARPAIHIGLLDYTLFEDHPEFYAAYKLINIKNHQVYNDDLTLYVVDLTRIDLATEEDRHYHIDSWARLMKASTWEELRMTASEDEALYEAAKALYYTCSDEEIRIRCLEREEYYQDLRNYERAIEQERSDRELERLGHEQDLRNYEKAIEQERLEHEQIIAQKDRAYQDALAENERLRAELERLKNT